ncbi:S8 family serine peptidase [Inhella gelatinilytica]|uniref:S8 family serine peptidase n=1 Tax=Inhella gelatinilytica TaxID=2795030 RepID=A0A931IV04_9BURK|nr:S8 family serine peptidase [Inhella gelatinilytica]MBH9552447.1 S8 family serine peptidase [Inhella gelatinilytica]
MKRLTPTFLQTLLTTAGVLALSCAAHAANDTTRVIVSFKKGGAAPVKAAVAAAKGQIKHEIFGMDAMAIEVPVQALKGLQNNPHVEYVEEDAKRYPMALTTPSTGTPYALGQQVPYGIKMVQADQLSDDLAGNRKICIIDSGYDRSHPDLDSSANVTGEYDSGTGWWYTDENHHGTHVAGTIAAVNNAGTGVVGVMSNKKIKLHIVKVFSAAGWAYSSSLTTAANKCKAAGANVISMSLGGGRSSKTEQRAFDTLYSGGILSLAAAGNDGNTVVSYPAGYSSVMMVAAVDENKQWATFSQYNSAVEIAAPGVGVLSTVPMGGGRESALTVGSTSYTAGGMDGSPLATRTGALADFGIGDTVQAGAMTGKVCLIQRGTVDFATKVSNCQNSGGVGAIVYNNVSGAFGGTLGTTVTTIPSVTASMEDGTAMKAQLGQSATVAVTPTNYAYYDGTSMATPHASAVAALVWSRNLSCTAAQLRNSLNKSAEDLGTAGRDTKYGFGLIRAKAADDRIKSLGCGN